MCGWLSGCLYNYSYYCGTTGFDTKIEEYKFNESILHCPRCSKTVKGVLKQHIAQNNFCCCVLNEEKVGKPVVFCNNCDYCFGQNAVLDEWKCRKCRTVYSFECDYCIKCGREIEEIGP